LPASAHTERKLRLQREDRERRQQLFEHYATGGGKDVPLARVAANMGITEAKARAGLLDHGRRV
jgi:hypothetical protein